MSIRSKDDSESSGFRSADCRIRNCRSRFSAGAVDGAIEAGDETDGDVEGRGRGDRFQSYDRGKRGHGWTDSEGDRRSAQRF